MQRQSSITALAAVIILSSCAQPQLTISTSASTSLPPVVSPTSTSTSPPPTSTPTAIPTPTHAPIPTHTPVIPPTPTPEPQPIGTFIPIPLAEDQPPGDIRDLRVADDGTLWVITREAVGSLRDGEWTTHQVPSGILLGFDGFGRVWVVDERGETISAWDGEVWTNYGPDEGWAPTGRLFQEAGYGNISEGLVTDRDGSIWIATRDDVRVFDGQRWSIYGPQEVGFEQTEEMIDMGVVPSLTDVALDRFGNVWVGDCAWMGPGPMGHGARWFDGQAWHGQDSPEVGVGCVEDIEVDQAGRIWLGVDGGLYRHTPGEGWISFPHPVVPASGNRRWGWLVDLELSAEGSVWVGMSPCGGASCDSGVFITFFVDDDGWTEVSDKGSFDFALDESGNGWMCIADELYSVRLDQLELVFTEESFRCTVEMDPSGRAWMGVLGHPTLWLYDPAGD